LVPEAETRNETPRCPSRQHRFRREAPGRFSAWPARLRSDLALAREVCHHRGMKELSPAQEKLKERAVAIMGTTAQEANSLGFLTRVLVQASLPHREPKGDRRAWIRKNGNYSLVIQPGVDGNGDSIGYPFGVIPRLVFQFLTTYVVRTREQDVDLGNSLSSFMRAVGLHSNGRDIRRMKDQLNRLFSAGITFRRDDDTVRSGAHRPIAREFQFWWNERQPDQHSLFPNFVRLDDEFYREILAHPVPVDLRAIHALKHSSLALDLYTWLNHRVSYLNGRVRIPWTGIEKHIGSEYADPRDFRRAAKHALLKIKAIWPELDIELDRGALVLKPSQTHVPRAKVHLIVPPK